MASAARGADERASATRGGHPPDARPIVAGGLNAPEAMAVDDQWLYFMDEQPEKRDDRSVFRVRRDGGTPERLAVLPHRWRHTCGVAQDAQWLFIPLQVQKKYGDYGEGGLGGNVIGGGGGHGSDADGMIMRVSKARASEPVKIASGGGACQPQVAAGRVIWREGRARSIRSADPDGRRPRDDFRADRDERIIHLRARGDRVVAITDRRVVGLRPDGAAAQVLAKGELVNMADFLDDGRLAFTSGDALLAVASDGSHPAEQLSDDYRLFRDTRVFGDRTVWTAMPAGAWWPAPGHLFSRPLPGAPGERISVGGLASEAFVGDQRALFVARGARDGRRAELVRLDRAEPGGSVAPAMQRLIAEDAAPWDVGPDPLSSSAGEASSPWARFSPRVLSRQSVRDALDEELQSIGSHCLGETESHPVVFGRVELLVFVNASGQVADVAVTATDLNDLDIESCLRRSIKRSIHFVPATPPRDARVVYSLPGSRRIDDPDSAFDTVIEARADGALARTVSKKTVAGCGTPPQAGVRASFYVDEEGVVRSVGLAAPEPIPDTFGSCVARQIQQWHLPPAAARQMALAHLDVSP